MSNWLQFSKKFYTGSTLVLVFKNLLFQVCSDQVPIASPLHDSFVFFPCLSNSPLPPITSPSSFTPLTFPSLAPPSRSPQTHKPTLPTNNQAVTHHVAGYIWRTAPRDCILFSSHTTETADYNYFDSPPLVCVAGNSSCMKLLTCSQWMVGEWMTFQWYIYSELMNDKWLIRTEANHFQIGWEWKRWHFIKLL